MSYQFEKHFTLEQANAMIPHVRRLFAEVIALLKTSEDSPLPAFDDPATHHHGNGNGNGNGNTNGNGKKPEQKLTTPPAADYTGWSDEKRHEAAYRLLNALQTQGIVIQDVERGLIDFPSIRDGEEVFLCYELNDGLSIGYFHAIDAGYAGRQHITESKSE